MKFSEAMDLLQNGATISREIWKEKLHLKLIGNEVKSFQPIISHYSYNEDIMISTGWLVDDLFTEYKFCEIIPFLMKGSKARLSDWNGNTFIFLDTSTKMLVIHSMEIFPFTPDFTSFVAEDWIKLS